MAVDKNKIVAEATKLVQKGSLDKAIATYQKILAEDPKDVRVLLKVGELYQKKEDNRLAADAFTRVAETYAEQGFFLKSVAVYKQILKLAPEDVRVNERLGALYQQLGLMSDAMGQLQLMAAAHEKAGDAGKLTEVLQRMVELDPENIASSIKLGELHARAGRSPQALDCFRRAADYLKKHNRTDEYLKVAERIAALQDGDLGLTRELAHIYLAKGDTKRALAKLQLCFKADPKDVDTLNLLAQAFRDLGQTGKTLSVYKELAHVHAEQGRHGDARAIWRKVQELAPEDEDAAVALGSSRATPTPAPAPPPPAAASVRAPPSGPPPGVARSGHAAAPAGSDALSKLLTETDVYVKYGLHDKALEHLRKVLAVDPQLPEAHERARELHVAAGRPSDAGDAGVAAVRALLVRGQPDRAREAFHRLRQIDPGNPVLSELAAATGATEEVSIEAEEIEELSESPEVVLDPDEARPASADADELALSAAGHDSEELVAEEDPGPGELTPEADEGVALEVAEPEPHEGEPELVPEPEDEPAPFVLAPPAPPPRPAARARQPAVIAPPPPAAKPAAAARHPPPAPPEASEEEEADLGDELEEAEFFLQQGLLDEARDALRNLLQFYPGHRAVEAKLAEVERRAAPARPAPAAAPKVSPSLVKADGGDDAFDIARELAEELGDAPPAPSLEEEFQYSVEDVFSQFKKGVEATVKPEDSATHYDLGIAYREMGLLDDALHEFETAARGNDRKREIDCLTMIGLCRMAKGEPREAVQAYRRALGSEFLTREAAKAIHFDLSAAYEASGDVQVALFYLQKVAKADPAFREVAARVQALGGGPGRPPAEGEARPAGRPVNGAAPVARAPAPGAPQAAPRPASPPATKKNIGYL